jgi:hypothetical protein
MTTPSGRAATTTTWSPWTAGAAPPRPRTCAPQHAWGRAGDPAGSLCPPVERRPGCRRGPLQPDTGPTGLHDPWRRDSWSGCPQPTVRPSHCGGLDLPITRTPATGPDPRPPDLLPRTSGGPTDRRPSQHVRGGAPSPARSGLVRPPALEPEAGMGQAVPPWPSGSTGISGPKVVPASPPVAHARPHSGVIHGDQTGPHVAH